MFRQTDRKIDSHLAVKAVEECLKNNNFNVLIISATERQAQELFFKCLNYAENRAPKLIRKGKDRPTKHVVNFRNNSIIRCLPTGVGGNNIRGYTVNLLIADEAAFIDDDVWQSVTPMLMTTGGAMWLVSTPRGKVGYFWERYNDPNYKVFHINSEQAMIDRPIGEGWSQYQRDGALKHLEAEKKVMSEKQYAQEYLGCFVDDLSRLFSDELIAKCCVEKRPTSLSHGNFYLGVDV